MKMEDRGFKITILLYLGILILPVAFFYSFSQLNTLEKGGYTLRELSRDGGDMLLLPLLTDKGSREEKIRQIDKSLHSLRPWFVKNDRGASLRYYLGDQTPLKDYNALMQCWEDLKKDISRTKAIRCWRKVKEMGFAVERLDALRLDHLRNSLYLTLAGSMALLLLLVFAVRSYIDYQLKQQALHDETTGLYNRKYCLSALKHMVAQSHRQKQPLSILKLKIHKLDAYDDETLERLLRRFGEYLNRGLRGSDIACRYADNNFWILLPNTPPEGVEALKTRLLENMKKEFSEEFTGFNLETSIGLLESEESEEAFVRRISQKKEG